MKLLFNPRKDFEMTISRSFIAEFGCDPDINVQLCSVHFQRVVEARSRKLKIWSELATKKGVFHGLHEDLSMVSYTL